MNGTNNKNNKVLLTGKEHFLAHRLLYKIYPHEISIIRAYHAMFAHLSRRGYVPSARNYGEVRTAYSELHILKSQELI
jgi:hypothetical protein